jgi:predicted ATPase
MLAEPPLVGRDETLGRLNGLLCKMKSGSGGLVLLSGEAGIGKTRLATEFEIKAEASGCRILVGNCLPSARIPYMVFLDALNDLFVEGSEKRMTRTSRFVRSAKKAAPELMSAVPLIGNTLQASATLLQKYKGEAGEPGKEHVLFRTLELLRTESLKKPLVLHLDDLQWADSMSIGMLHFLARNCREMRVLLLGTYRSEEVLNKEAGIHPFLESIRVMKREGLIEELHLKPLAEKELNQVVSGMLERPVSELVLDRIFKESGGSPLFAVETVRLLESNGSMVLKDGRWTIPGSLENVIPTSVKEVILRRVERTSKEERKALDYASVIGLTFNPELLANALKKDQLLLLENLEHLESDHQLVREIDIGYMFAHEKVRKFTYDCISNLRRKEIHRTVGSIVESQLPNDALYPDLAIHFYSANDDQKAMKYSLLAGEFCMRREAAVEALPHFKRVLEIGSGIPGFDDYRTKAMEGLGDSYNVMGDAESASKYYEEILELHQQDKREARVLSKLANCWSPVRLGKGSSGKAVNFIDLAHKTESIDAEDEAEILSVLALIAVFEDNWEEAKLQTTRSIEALRRSGNKNKLCLRLCESSDVFFSLGESDTVMNLLTEAEELNRSIMNPDLTAQIDLRYGLLNFQRGELEKAGKHFDDYREINKKLGHEGSISIAYFFQSILASLVGDKETAVRSAENSLEHASMSGSDYLKTGALAALTHSYFIAGNVADCQRQFVKTDEISSKFDKSMKSHIIGMVLVTRAETCMLNKEYENANIYFNQAIEMFQTCAFGKLLEAPTSMWFGDALRMQGRVNEAIGQFSNAIISFEKVGNLNQSKRCAEALNRLKK